jgi:formylglycine-generating enzyme required for sulfatase activity
MVTSIGWTDAMFVKSLRLRAKPALSVIDDKEDAAEIVKTNSRVLRGGSFTGRASNLRSASRAGIVPTDWFDDLGLRPARTFIP